MADIEAVSILDIVKRGGYEASLITTFNATLPFYEEVVLRRLVAVGVRHNIVLMDAVQCAQSWASEASRPRLAGHAYTLVPMRMHGAFHPKICVLVGPKKAAVLIGSHNLTLSGFGYNHEVTNWIEVEGPKDAEGAAALTDTWALIEQWIEQQRPFLPEQVVDTAKAFSNFLQPLTQRAPPAGHSGVLGQFRGSPTLWAQLIPQLPEETKRVAVIGAFFDSGCKFLRTLEAQWPLAEVVVAIDPETVQLGADVSGLRSRFVDARSLWHEPAMTYLHAKAVYIEGDEAAVLVSGSANPSWPAWMTTDDHGNTEAVVVRTSAAAKAAAKAMGILDVFACAALDTDVLLRAAARTRAEISASTAPAETICVGVSDTEQDVIAMPNSGGRAFASAIAVGADPHDQWPASIQGGQEGWTHFRVEADITAVRSLLVRPADYGTPLRVLVHHPAALSGLARTKRQAALREALGALGSGEADVARLIASVEKVIFSEDVANEVRAGAGRQGNRPPTGLPERPESLGVHVTDMPKQRRKLRLLKSGDLAYLLDVLIRRLGLDLPGGNKGTDQRGRTEEESIGKDDQTPEPAAEPTGLSDTEIAEIVLRKSRTLIRRMVDQLELAAKDESRVGMAIVQLVAVLGVVRELRRLRNFPRWRSRPSFVAEKDRRLLLERAMAYLFGTKSMLLWKLLGQSDEPIEEVSHLRSLLLWLAWDLGEELTDRISPMLEPEDLMRRIQANAILYELLPSVAADGEEVAELERSVAMTATPTGEEGARATTWITRHLGVGLQIANAGQISVGKHAELRVGALAVVPGSRPPRLRVVAALTGSEVSLYEFDGQRVFDRRVASFSGRIPAGGTKP
ncbi:hypothetical protein JI739_05155 [Ramlibacter sp. AW1]|uniref:PLD phosphodiesterase domain-containing protein n=1 Tax=Ramlibacter aurantiacus TaxID=2801330 RepID=A0A936ZLZ0_9BURK|nr:hypothetical protein [Ramlibacter aurantiacus]MBL0419733.1 hypothetical protein [Ramlibacter aurantiacus]